MSLQPETVLATLMQTVVPRLGDWCAIHLVDAGGTPRLRAAAHADSGHDRLLRVLEQHEWEAISHESHHPLLTSQLRARTAVVLPLSCRGATLGALTLAFSDSGRTYDGPLIAHAERVVLLAAIALDNARLYEEQADVAHALQAALLPDALPVIDGVEVASRHRATGRGNEAGGDFYDVFRGPGDRTWLIMGDVVGSGSAAAALTSRIRHGFQALATQCQDLEQAFEGVNQVLLNADEGTLATAVAGVLSRTEGGLALQLAVAGHPAPLILRDGGARVEEVGASGRLLGVFDTLELHTEVIELGAGDAVVLYTDGAIELRAHTTQQGEAHLRESLRAGAGDDAATLLERVEHDALLASRGEPRDDMALLALRVHSGERRRPSREPTTHVANIEHRRHVLRGANQRIAAGRTGGEGSLPIGFLCECGARECGRLVELTAQEYETVQSQPHTFLVAHNHPIVGIDHVVRNGDSCVLVSRVNWQLEPDLRARPYLGSDGEAAADEHRSLAHADDSG